MHYYVIKIDFFFLYQIKYINFDENSLSGWNIRNLVKILSLKFKNNTSKVGTELRRACIDNGLYIKIGLVELNFKTIILYIII